MFWPVTSSASLCASMARAADVRDVKRSDTSDRGVEGMEIELEAAPLAVARGQALGLHAEARKLGERHTEPAAADQGTPREVRFLRQPAAQLRRQRLSAKLCKSALEVLGALEQPVQVRVRERVGGGFER